MTIQSKNNRTQNVTLAIPKATLKRAKIIAVQRDISLSKLLTSYIESIVENDNQYSQSKEKALLLLETRYPFGTEGKTTWTRDDLHER